MRACFDRLDYLSCLHIQQCRIECHAYGRCRCEEDQQKRLTDRNANNNSVLLRSRNDIQQSYIREWQKTTARDGNIKPQTVLSTLWFVPIWLKHQAVPDILRYAWYIVWVKIVAAYRRYHAWAVLQGVAASDDRSPHNDPMQVITCILASLMCMLSCTMSCCMHSCIIS